MSSKERKPFYGYYALGRFHITVALWTILGILITAFLWQPMGIAIIGFGTYAILTYWLGLYLSRQSESYDLSQSDHRRSQAPQGRESDRH